MAKIAMVLQMIVDVDSDQAADAFVKAAEVFKETPGLRSLRVYQVGGNPPSPEPTAEPDKRCSCPACRNAN